MAAEGIGNLFRMLRPALKQFWKERIPVELQIN
jgi:hypothetical protein